MNEHILRVGIAGYGYSARIFHIPFLLHDLHFSIRKIFSRQESICRIKDIDCNVVHTFDELLSDDIDLIIICTPNTEHFWMAEKAIQAGKHVVIEKPICIRSDEVMVLKRLAIKHGVKISAYQNRRFDGPFLTAQNIIRSGKLGEIVEYDASFDRFVQGKNKKEWKNLKTEGVNILYDLGVHLIDQVLALFGKPREVYADLQHQRYETPCFDNFEVILYYDDMKVSLRAGELVSDETPHIVIRGRKGSFVKFGRDVQEDNLKAGHMPDLDLWGEENKDKYGKMFIYDGTQINTVTIPTVPGNYGCFYENFYNAVMFNEDLIVDIDDSFWTVKIIENALASADRKKRMCL